MNFKRAKQEIEKTLAVINEATIKLEAQKQTSAHKRSNPGSKLSPEQHLARFKQTELLSHIIAYATYLDTEAEKVILMDGQSCRILEKKIAVKDEDGVKRLYNVKKIPTNNAGLVSYILYDDNPENNRVHVLFRGTHNAASMRRDLETFGFGPGSLSFDNNKEEILRNIKQIVHHKQQKCKEKIELNIAGHSLGGADAQMCATAILEDVANHPRKNPLEKIGSLNIMHANSAGVSYGTAKTAEKSLIRIKSRKPDFKVSQHIIHVGGDLVQQSGFSTILVKPAHKQYVDTNLLKADVQPKYKSIVNQILLFLGKVLVVPGLKNTYVAHTTIHWHGKKEKADFKFKTFNNQEPGEDLIIAKDLKRKVLSNLYKTFSPRRFMKKTRNLFGQVASEKIREHKKRHRERY